jgi:hypothetical protein
MEQMRMLERQSHLESEIDEERVMREQDRSYHLLRRAFEDRRKEQEKMQEEYRRRMLRLRREESASMDEVHKKAFEADGAFERKPMQRAERVPAERVESDLELANENGRKLSRGSQEAKEQASLYFEIASKLCRNAADAEAAGMTATARKLYGQSMELSKKANSLI